MPDMNFLGVGRRSAYEDGDKEIRRFPFLILIMVSGFSVCNFEYLYNLARLLYDTSGVTVLLFKTFYGLTVVYPWITACFFIGQYTKRHFLFLRHMAPLLSVSIIAQCILSPFYFGKMDEYPSLSKALYGNLKLNITSWDECENEVNRNLAVEKQRCGKYNTLNYSSLCFIRKEEFLVPYKSVFEDLVQPITGTLACFLLLFNGFKVLTMAFGCILFFYIGGYMTGLFFIFVRFGVANTIQYFLYFDSSGMSSLNVPMFITFIGWEIQTLTLNSPLLIMLGGHLPIHKTPTVSALLVAVYQCIYVLFIFFAYESNAAIVGIKYNTSIGCITSPDYFESSLCSEHLTAIILYEDQGIVVTHLIQLFNFLMKRLVQLLFITIHTMPLYYMVLDELPLGLYRHKMLHYFILLLCCFLVNMGVHICTVKNDVSLHYITPFVTTVGLFNSVTFTSAIFFIYGTYKLNNDMMFLHSRAMIPSVRILMITLPFTVVAYFLWQFYYYMIMSPVSLTDRNVQLGVAKPFPYYTVVLVPMVIMIACIIISVIVECLRGNVSEAFLPSKKWALWSPKDENYQEERENYYPELAVKFDEDYYRCAHKCWLDNSEITKEINESKRTYKQLLAEVRHFNVQHRAPTIYKEYKHVLPTFKSK